MTTDQNQVVLFGLRLDAIRMNSVLAKCEEHLVSRKRLLIGVVNAAKVVNLGRNALLRDSLLQCDILLADGQSVVWVSKLLRRPLPERVTGIDLFEHLIERAADNGHSIYLLGAQADVLATLQKELLAKYPGLVIAGAHDGYYDDADSDAIAAEIRGSGADMLFLGMTSPKKEIFLARFGDNLDVPILHGVGGSFDIFAGITKRAPRLWQVMGCEWLYRVIQEPGRLWYRYLTTNTTFLWLTLRELFRPLPEYRKTTGAARVDIAP